MLSDEEKREYIEHEILDRLYCLEENDFDKNKVDDGYIKAVLNACKEAKNLIEKQQKEIEELKEKNEYLPSWVNRKYISKDKIEAKIEEKFLEAKGLHERGVQPQAQYTMKLLRDLEKSLLEKED